MRELTVYQRFDAFVKKLFESLSFQYIGTYLKLDFRYDMLFEKKGEKLTVEIKLYRSKEFSNEIIENEAKRLASELNGIESIKSNNSPNLSGLVIVSSILSEEIKHSIIDSTGITIWDRSDLFKLVDGNSILREDLKNILLSNTLTELDVLDGINLSVETNVNDALSIKPKAVRSKAELKTELKNELKEIELGNDGARLFEIKCIETLKYVFEGHLTSWKEQNTTDDDLHRFDLICRIASSHDFWKSLITFFKSRYIVFEFKNYSAEIEQGQIYSTEKYLYTQGLRSVGIIIARNGASKNAIKAVKGVLRETGKLIILLSLDDLVKLINLKEENDDPSSYLAEIMDKLLLELSK